MPKYDRYDPCVKAMMISLYAEHNSMIKVGKIIGQQIYSPFSLDSERFLYAIPRQTIQNTIRKASIIDVPLSKSKNTPENIYVMADEKWVPLQSHDVNGGKQKQMVKATVVFEDIECASKNVHTLKSRRKLVHKYIHLSTEQNFWESIYEKINERYDYDKIKTIHILGDGAQWIKNGTSCLRTSYTNTDFY